MDFYRKHWFDVGGVLAIFIVVGLLFWSNDLSRVQFWLVLYFVALLVHQFEEYRFPGYFPGQFNGGIMKSDDPDRYPMNPHMVMLVNVIGGYLVHVVPVFLPKVVWLGLGPVLFGFVQVLGHGIVQPRKSKVLYSPGFISALLLSLPIGILYIRQISADGLLDGADWIWGGIYAIVIGGGILGGSVTLLKDKNSPYRFTPQQLGRWGAGR